MYVCVCVCIHMHVPTCRTAGLLSLCVLYPWLSYRVDCNSLEVRQGDGSSLTHREALDWGQSQLLAPLDLGELEALQRLDPLDLRESAFERVTHMHDPTHLRIETDKHTPTQPTWKVCHCICPEAVTVWAWMRKVPGLTSWTLWSVCPDWDRSCPWAPWLSPDSCRMGWEKDEALAVDTWMKQT